MKAVAVAKFGAPENLQYMDWADPRPGTGEAAEAHRYLESRGARGKLLLKASH